MFDEFLATLHTLHVRYRQHSDWRKDQGESHDSQWMVSELWLPQYWAKATEELPYKFLELDAYDGPEENYPKNKDWKEWEINTSRGNRAAWISMYHLYSKLPLPPDHAEPGSSSGAAPAASSAYRRSRSTSLPNKIPRRQDVEEI